jgi:flagella basal body P-ring formation protein FlgA
MPIQRLISILLIAIGSIGLAAPLAMGSTLDEHITTVSLRPTVRLAFDHSQLTINDIATIEGPQATAIKALPIPTDAPIASGQWTPLACNTVRTLIEQAPGVQSGSIVISGGDLSITRRPTTKPNADNTPSSPALQPKAASTLRDQIEQWVYTLPWLKSTPESTRIQFSNTQRDQNLLNTPTRGRTVILKEIGRSKNISVEIIIYEHDRLITETTIRFEVQVQRPVRVTTALIMRSELITAEKTVVETRWLSPMDPIVDPQAALGQASKKSINAGSQIINSMIEQPLLVKRGQIVSARSLSGRVSITMSVRARSNGRLGEIIELESRDHTQQFTARVAGPGRVVILKDKPTEPHDD